MLRDFDIIISNARNLLTSQTWVAQYKGYAEAMWANIDFIMEKRRLFREWAPLYFYINTSKAMAAATTLVLDVRYMGQTVAAISCDKNHRVTISTKDYDANNRRDFNCEIQLHKVDWKEAADFRRYFRNREPIRNDTGRRNDEHNIESMLITEFKKCGRDKLLRGIQPVQLAGNIRFSMPTVFSASKHANLRVANNGKGGGVDILARVGSSGANIRLCVIEIKDENCDKEPPEAALHQAVEYAVFLRELLRSDAGALWWKLFGFTKEIPEPGRLVILAAVAMPTREPDKPDDVSFARKCFDVEGDSIECHYIYFSASMDKSSLQSIKTSLPQIRNSRAL